MVIGGVSWRDYVILREVLDRPGLRMTYCEGALELVSRTFAREYTRKSITRIFETYAFLRDLPLIGYGSPTFRLEAKQRGAEPDACCCVGRQIREGEFPDIVLEVIHTTPLLDKLDVYRGFGIAEVWLFQNSEFALHRLTNGEYVRIDRSSFFPDLDFALIAQLVIRPDQDEVLRELKRML